MRPQHPAWRPTAKPRRASRLAPLRRQPAHGATNVPAAVPDTARASHPPPATATPARRRSRSRPSARCGLFCSSYFFSLLVRAAAGWHLGSPRPRKAKTRTHDFSSPFATSPRWAAERRASTADRNSHPGGDSTLSFSACNRASFLAVRLPLDAQHHAHCARAGHPLTSQTYGGGPRFIGDGLSGENGFAPGKLLRNVCAIGGA